MLSLSLPNECQRVVRVLKSFPEVVAIGLEGSFASGQSDAFSDLDMRVFVAQDFPSSADRRARYAKARWTKFNYFDLNFGMSLADSARIGNLDFDLDWIKVPALESYLSSLATEYDHDEGFAGAMGKVIALHDPDGVIDSLKQQIPTYSEERAARRAAAHLRGAHHRLYVLKWLEKAVARGDHACFLSHQSEIMGNFFSALFALNRRWFSDEKRLLEIVRGFEIAPRDLTRRLRRTLLRRGRCASGEGCLREIKGLFHDLAALAKKRAPGIDVPVTWK